MKVSPKKKKTTPHWIKKTKLPAQNIVTRLFHREIQNNHKSPLHQTRIFYQNIAPNFTITNVCKPPCFLRKFSPDGRRVYSLKFNFYTT